jgi:hypothetical protein
MENAGNDFLSSGLCSLQDRRGWKSRVDLDGVQNVSAGEKTPTLGSVSSNIGRVGIPSSIEFISQSRYQGLP